MFSVPPENVMRLLVTVAVVEGEASAAVGCCRGRRETDVDACVTGWGGEEEGVEFLKNVVEGVEDGGGRMGRGEREY